MKSIREVSICTYARVKPRVDGHKNAASMNVTAIVGREEGWIDYRIQTVPLATPQDTAQSGSSSNRDLLHIQVPGDVDPGLVVHNTTDGKLTYEFDQVFDTEASQADIFDVVVRSRLEDAMRGINSTIFAYGQTGSGKTYSMSGGDSFSSRGLIPRTIGAMFENIKASAAAADAAAAPPPKHRVQISFTEVYNEVVYDLLDARQRELSIQQRTPVQIMEGTDGLLLRNVNVYEVQAEADALGLFFMGSTARIQDATTMNAVSSRSHAVFTVLLDTTAVTDGNVYTFAGKLNLVDLAGSERMYKMQNSDRQRNDAKSINLSLHYLEQVILSLRSRYVAAQSSNTSHSHAGVSMLTANTAHAGVHIPYRNSVLTSMLRDSLGGNCRACFLLTVSIDRLHFEETVSTCRFGQRCGEVKIRVGANVQVPLLEQVKIAQKQTQAAEGKLALAKEEHARITAGTQAQVEALRAQLALAQAAAATAAMEVPAQPVAAASPAPSSSPAGDAKRTLSPQEQEECRLCVQELLGQARIAINLQQADFQGKNKLTTATSNRVSALQTKALKIFCDAVAHTQMNRPKLIEMAGALAQLVQVLYTEREMLIFQEKRNKEKKSTEFATHAAELEHKRSVWETVVERAAMEHEVDTVKAKTTSANPGAAGAGAGPSVADRTTDGQAGTNGAATGVGIGTERLPTFNEMGDVLQRGNYFLKTSSSLGTKNVRFVCLSPDSSCLYWRRVDGSGKPNMVFLHDFSGFEMTGRNRNTILMSLHSGDVLRFKYVNGSNMADSAALASYWCESLSILSQQAHERLANPTLARDLLQDATSPDRAGAPRPASFDNVHGDRVHGGAQKVPEGTPVRKSSAVPVTSPQRLHMKSTIHANSSAMTTASATPDGGHRNASPGSMTMTTQIAVAAAEEDSKRMKREEKKNSIKEMHALVDSIEARLQVRRPSKEAATGTYIDEDELAKESNGINSKSVPTSPFANSDSLPTPPAPPLMSRGATIPSSSQLQMQPLQSSRRPSHSKQQKKDKEIDLDTSL